IYIQQLIKYWNGEAAIKNPDDSFINSTLISDASGTIGFGAINPESKTYIHDKWTVDEIKQAQRQSATSSTHLEILAICKGIRSLIKPNSSLQVISDSQTALS